jgi:hypothetical protein
LAFGRSDPTSKIFSRWKSDDSQPQGFPHMSTVVTPTQQIPFSQALISFLQETSNPLMCTPQKYPLVQQPPRCNKSAVHLPSGWWHAFFNRPGGLPRKGSLPRNLPTPFKTSQKILQGPSAPGPTHPPPGFGPKSEKLCQAPRGGGVDIPLKKKPG